MEITTIIGIVIAVVIMAFGLRLLLKKPNDAAPSLESELQFNEESQKPIIPRHVRDQLQASEAQIESERVEPILDEQNVNPESDFAKTEPTLKDEKSEKNEDDKAEENIVVDVETTEFVGVDDTKEKLEVENTDKDSSLDDVKQEVAEAKAEQNFSLNANIEKAEISAFEEESSILDAHLHEQKVVDDESALATASMFIALNLFPERRVLSGEKTLKVLLKYGLRFGEMSCFHRYDEDANKLLFSVLQITEDGAEGFDLETLSTEEVKGLAFFLALPHGDVQNAFDTMVSIAGLIAREIDGTVYDQNNHELTPQLREYWRHQAIDYRPN